MLVAEVENKNWNPIVILEFHREFASLECITDKEVVARTKGSVSDGS
jgi:hypothetical protein